MTKYGTAALALAGVLALSATEASAQWRRHHHWGPGVGIGAGLAAGALIGSAVAARPYYYGGYYADPGYGYYEAPVASYGYYGAPYYYDDTQSRSPSRNWGYRYNCGGSYGQGRDCSEGDTGR